MLRQKRSTGGGDMTSRSGSDDFLHFFGLPKIFRNYVRMRLPLPLGRHERKIFASVDGENWRAGAAAGYAEGR